MGEAFGAVVQRLLRLVNRKCFTAFGLWFTRQFRRTVMRGISHLFDRRLLEYVLGSWRLVLGERRMSCVE